MFSPKKQEQLWIKIFHSILAILCLVSISAAQTIYRSARIPSEAAEENGIALAIKIPQTARYQNTGAPIAIYHRGGFKSVGIGEKSANLTEFGFIEIFFN